MKSPFLLNVATAVTSTVAAAALIAMFSTMTAVKTDVALSKVLLQEHKDQHVVLEQSVREQGARLSQVEQQTAINTLNIKYLTGENVAYGGD